MNLKSKAAAALAVLLALCMISPALVPSDLEEPVVLSSDEYDTGFAWSVLLLGVAIGYVIKWTWDEYINNPSDDNSSQARQSEADYVAGVINSNVTTAMNFTDTISELIPLTSEYFIRQGELAASYLWEQGKDYDVQKILSSASVRDNLSKLQTNIFGGFSQILTQVEGRMDQWNAKSTYSDKMTVSFLYDTTAGISSKTSAGGLYLPVTEASGGSNRVYICGPDLYVEEDATITREDGRVIQLYSGHNRLGESFVPGVYTLQNNRVYAGYMLPSMTTSSAPLYAGMVMQAGDAQKIAYLDASGLYTVNGTSYSAISMRVTTTDGYETTMNVSRPLTVLSAAYTEMCKIQTRTSVAASSVWSIYDAAGASNAFITTLSVPNMYENMELSKTEKEIVTLLAMEQLAEYYEAHSGNIKSNGYVMSDSFDLYCSGTIYDANGNTLIENAVFTPFFYTKDVTLYSSQNNVIAQNGTIAVWAQNTSLSSWNGQTNEASLLSVYDGCSMHISEMTSAGNSVSSFDLRIKSIDITILRDYEGDHTDAKNYDTNDTLNKIQFVLIIIGLIVMCGGVYYKRLDLLFIGAVLLISAIFLIKPIAGYLGLI